MNVIIQIYWDAFSNLCLSPWCGRLLHAIAMWRLLFLEHAVNSFQLA